MNVSSIVVRTASDYLQDVIDEINALDYCEVHFYDSDGRIVATIEDETIHGQVQSLKRIQNIPRVYSANLMYSYCEEELLRALEDGTSGDNRLVC